MKIAIASDHGGFELKQVIMAHLNGRGVEYEDLGCFTEDSCDYPDYGLLVGEKVSSGEFDRGIAICGTGIGICISANKVPKVRCSLCNDIFTARLTRQHNDANVLALGGRVVGPGLAVAIVDAWLDTPAEGGRHARRVEKIRKIEKKYMKGV